MAAKTLADSCSSDGFDTAQDGASCTTEKPVAAAETATAATAATETAATGPTADPQLPVAAPAVYMLLFALCLGLFLVNIEVTIVSTSLFAITSHLDGYYQTGWLVSGYLGTYSAFIVPWAKLSDITGRKTAIMAAVACFTCFSVGCGAAQSMESLQGIGAAGCYSLVMVVFFEAVPKRWYGPVGGLLSAFIALAALSGPLLGAVITERASWRWIFYLNGPLGLLTLLILFFTIPSKFPNHRSVSKDTPGVRDKHNTRNACTKFDVLGSTLLVLFSVLFVTAILQAGTRQVSWSSPLTVSFLIFSTISFIVFAIWERHITASQSVAAEPVFPWRFLQNRAWCGMLLTSFFSGVVFNVVIVNVPQRFQNVNQLSTITAGLWLLPFSLAAPVTSTIATVVTGRGRIAFVYVLILASSFQLIGVGLLTSVPSDAKTHSAQYGYEIIAGAGFGAIFGVLSLAIPYSVEKRDLATATGALIQLRMLGGAIGIAVSSAIFNSFVWSKLAKFLSPDELNRIQQLSSYTSSLDAAIKTKVLGVLAEGFRLQMILATVAAGAALLSCTLVWRKQQLSAVG